jgi:HAD superfamily hydrolase (TIGR01490 family)
MNIAFFDFDGTITRDDSLLKFIRFIVGDFRFFIGLVMLSPILIAYKIKLIQNYKAKEKILSYFFKGMQEKKFKQIAKIYSLKHIDKIVRDDAIHKIKWHQSNGDEVVVVSASIECWLKPWCNKNNLKLIATKLKVENEIITGKLLSKNCYGIEKVNKIKQIYNLNNFDIIYAYGDSKGDKEMLELADKKFYKYFKG